MVKGFTVLERPVDRTSRMRGSVLDRIIQAKEFNHRGTGSTEKHEKGENTFSLFCLLGMGCNSLCPFDFSVFSVPLW
jgi:hypothetical protein